MPKSKPTTTTSPSRLWQNGHLIVFDFASPYLFYPYFLFLLIGFYSIENANIILFKITLIISTPESEYLSRLAIILHQSEVNFRNFFLTLFVEMMSEALHNFQLSRAIHVWRHGYLCLPLHSRFPYFIPYHSTVNRYAGQGAIGFFCAIIHSLNS